MQLFFTLRSGRFSTDYQNRSQGPNQEAYRMSLRFDRVQRRGWLMPRTLYDPENIPERIAPTDNNKKTQANIN